MPGGAGGITKRLLLHRIGLGLFLITAFSFGLAAVLVIIGLAMVYAKRAISSRVQTGKTALRYLPLLSSAFMVVLRGHSGICHRIRSEVAGSSVHRQTGPISHRDPAGIIFGYAPFHRRRPRRSSLHHSKSPEIHQKLRGYRAALGIGAHPDNFSGWIRNYYFRFGDSAPSWIIHGVLCCPHAYSVGSAKPDRCHGLDQGAHGPDERDPPQRRDCLFPVKSKSTAAGRMNLFCDETIGKLGFYQTLRPLVVGLAWPGRLGRSGTSGTFHHQASTLVDSLPAGFRFRHDGRNDAYDCGNLNAAGLCEKKFPDQSTPDRDFRFCQRGFWHLSRLPDWICRRAIQFAGALDPAMNFQTHDGRRGIDQIVREANA